ncbi:FAD-binding oxidoreductase [Roseibium sp. RKSG952]|uniref:NAD(P)/FAD-dependent oxidoreductase n=1 Tax=Roseibium sp. RKSG952 TaxID=2529384 RepID=UPI0012BD0922|nr:FAD-dependent oxidoreductase [Roseibium sp. RKSG952]MTH95294.1 FAD-dependent oxidoreductase [Roseibium sp. RKSG952]
MAEQSVHIIGAGIVGLAVAAGLADRGYTVTVLDRDAVAAGASQGNAGAIAWTDVAPLAAPGIWKQALSWLGDPLGPLAVRPGYALAALPWMLRFLAASRPARVHRSTQAIAALNARALPAWERLWQASGTHDQVFRDGCLEVFDKEADLQRHRASWEDQRAHGIEVEELDAEQLRALEPALSSRVAGGALVPGWVRMDDPGRLCLSLGNWLQTRNIAFRREAVHEIVPDGERVRLTTGAGQTIRTDKAVIACGAWSKPLAAQLGDRVPLDTERGYNITVANPGVSPNRFIMLPGHGFVLSPLSGGLRIGGAVEFGGLALPPNWKRVEAMVTKAKLFFPGLSAEEGTRWMGFRPSLPDSLPVIGLSRASRNVAYAFGHAHHGLTQAAVTGELDAKLLANETPEIDLTPFCARRF